MACIIFFSKLYLTITTTKPTMPKLLYIYFVVIIAVYGCKTCPEYNKELLSWQPYSVGDTLVFASAKDSIHFTINKHNITGGEPYKGNCECVCKVKSLVSAISLNHKDLYFNYTINDLKNNQLILEINNSFFSCVPNFKSNNYHIEYLKYNEIGKNWESGDFKFTEMQLPNKLYENTIELEADTSIYPGYAICKVYLAENYGLIGFVDMDTKREYYLQ